MPAGNRYVCIHGHFYQPPRENPWLEEIETQDSAYPFHDWNERISAECYAPNASSRMMNEKGRITEIVNNYSKISFNFGPTLLSWMKEKDPESYEAILEADRISQKRFSGHGSAMAQNYNHMIMPLANSRDKWTQVRWGVVDFESRFKRAPEGMWLAETAVDLESLEILAAQGIRFTVLAPNQAKAIRPLGKENAEWESVEGTKIDPSRAYLQRLPSGKSIVLFFYDGPVSQAVAFEKLLNNGETFANRLTSAFSPNRRWTQLAHIATDGETYGHHHRFGDMALAYALHHIEKNGMAKITNYGEFMEKHPPEMEVQILENTAWSCVHGVERWNSHCGCCTGSNPEWDQKWREPLRASLNWLRDELTSRYEEKARALLRDPWRARDDYIEVVLDRSRENLDRYFDRHSGQRLSDDERILVLKLQEMQRHCMLMFTSCGWFFDDLSGIETVQCIQYAARALQLGEEIFRENFEEGFKSRLEKARSNVPDQGNGREVYERYVQNAKVDLLEVAAHFAVDSVFAEERTDLPAASETDEAPPRKKLFCYEVDTDDYHRLESGRTTFLLGHTRVRSVLTLEHLDFMYGVFHFGDHNIVAGVKESHSLGEDYRLLLREGKDAFQRADFAAVIRLLDHHFENATYSIKSLFRDEQRRVLAKVLNSTYSEIDATYEQMYQRYYPLMKFTRDAKAPLPRGFRLILEYIHNIELKNFLQDQRPDVDQFEALLAEARLWNIQLDEQGIGLLYQRTLERLLGDLSEDPSDLCLLESVRKLAVLGRKTGFSMNLWKVQGRFYRMLKDCYPEFASRADGADSETKEWLTNFRSLGDALSFEPIQKS